MLICVSLVSMAMEHIIIFGFKQDDQNRVEKYFKVKSLMQIIGPAQQAERIRSRITTINDRLYGICLKITIFSARLRNGEGRLRGILMNRIIKNL